MDLASSQDLATIGTRLGGICVPLRFLLWYTHCAGNPRIIAGCRQNVSMPALLGFHNDVLSPLQIQSFGLEQREEVHEIEFLALLAFVARERQRLRTSSNPQTKFTRSDLEMAYAFRQHFGTQRGPSGNPLHSRPGAPQGPGHHGYGLQQRASQVMPKSATDSAIEAMTNRQGSQFRGASPRHANPLLSSSMQGERLGTSFRQSGRPPSQEFSSPQRHSRLGPAGGGLSPNRNSTGKRRKKARRVDIAGRKAGGSSASNKYTLALFRAGKRYADWIRKPRRQGRYRPARGGPG